ncbi:MAG: FMN-binding protein [Candidatus Adiutrix sp.]|jgi:major membrane immunogen (membrane-anchored lipoprotein)|nr:FMN-binding protein [Candidatus Adiutrix sp.]
MKTISLILAAALAAALPTACSQNSGGLRNGYYTAETASFDAQGWKEFITIYVHDQKIITVEYNAKNASGFIRSWDMDYMRAMDEAVGTYPNKYARAYKNALLSKQNPALVEAQPGAAAAHRSFQLLAEAALNQARTGDKKIVSVQLPDAE